MSVSVVVKFSYKQSKYGTLKTRTLFLLKALFTVERPITPLLVETVHGPGQSERETKRRNFVG